VRPPDEVIFEAEARDDFGGAGEKRDDAHS
jgi:hypothetical protein